MPKSAWLSIKFPFFPLLLLVGYGCSGGSGVSGGLPGATGADAEAQSSWIVGDWKGNYKNKVADEGSSLRETSAVANFIPADDKAKTGTFTFTLPLLEKVEVKGTYHDFQGKDLLLDVTTSNLSTVGLPNTSTDMSYDLVGDALELYNDRITLRLVRGKATTGTGTADGTDQPAADAVVGDWICSGINSFSWKITVKDETSFALDVFDPRGGRESIWMTGSVAITRGQTDADAVLTVTNAKTDKYKGLELRANTLGTNLMNVRRMTTATDGTKAVTETMPCNRNS